MSAELGKQILRDVEDLPATIDFSEVSGKEVLITGASGLIGQYLLASFGRAAACGYSPKNLYLVVYHEPPPYFAILCHDLPVTIIKADLADPAAATSLPSADIVIHAAGYGQPGKFLADPVRTLRLNTLATFTTLDTLTPGGKYVFVSSSEVYSGLTIPPFREEQIGTTNTDHPRACYIEGKRAGEAIVNAHRLNGVSAKSARLSLAYGPGTRPDDTRVMSNFIKKALYNGRIEMLDAGTAWRTYIYVVDAVELILDVLFRGTHAIYNVGGSSRTTIRNLATSIGDRLNVPVSLPHEQSGGLAGAPDDVFLDMSRSQREFGKTAFVTFEDGLDRTITWQKELYGRA
ncbi:MAG TPA: NAD-dependent epimerase/dehydratase family protein [Capsulimonadaceae bacterium]|jgi:nucleoside-diphosphate-sugar epimerase